ncbi:hypothetical protein TUMEXPCC7403_02580 [Tumidithrix helvetica PCC 7403]
MELSKPTVEIFLDAPEFNPENQGAQLWYEQYLKQREENQSLRQQLSQLQSEVEQLKEALRKLSSRNSDNSSQPPSVDGYKKKSKDIKQRKKKQGAKYGHEGRTRNGFASVDQTIALNLELCPECGNVVEQIVDTPVHRHQIAELVEKPMDIREYQRPKYRCSVCGWHGYAELPLGGREDFSYGVLLSSLGGWLGYGGHLSWNKQRYLVETVFSIPLSQGSLSKMHQWFCQSLYRNYSGWVKYFRNQDQILDRQAFWLINSKNIICNNVSK